MRCSGSDVLIHVLIEQGVDTIFGYPGGAVLNIYDALYDYSDRIRHILTVDEQGACYAADGYARATGKTGVVLATSGPGATNLVTGIANAYMDSIPLVAITGNVASDMIGKDSFQEIYITGCTMPITKHNFVVRKVEELAPILRRAFDIAESGRKGPVLVDLPKDITAALTEYVPVEPSDKPQGGAVAEPSSTDLDLVRKLIQTAERPLIYAGGGMISGQAEEALLALMEKAQIPACHTIMGIGALPDAHPLNLGMVGMHGKTSANRAVENCDLLLALGVRFSDRVALNFKHFAPQATLVHVDIDPSEHHKNVAVDLAVAADAKPFLEGLLALVQPCRHDLWQGELKAFQAEDWQAPPKDERLAPTALVETMAHFIGERGIMVTDVGQHQMWAAQSAHRSQPRTFITSGGLGAMGYGYGAAIGAALAKPDERVLHITGDGSFHMNMNELATAVHYKLPIVTVIFDNQALGMPRQWQHYIYKDRYAMSDFFHATDYVAFAEALGARGDHPRNMTEFEGALADAFARPGPTVIWCEIDRHAQVLPMIPAGGTVADSITTA